MKKNNISRKKLKKIIKKVLNKESLTEEERDICRLIKDLTDL